jgi:hypothetical protein
MQYAICNMQYACDCSNNVQYAICNMQYAICNMPATALIAIEKLRVTRGEREGGNEPSKCAAKALFDANFRHVCVAKLGHSLQRGVPVGHKQLKQLLDLELLELGLQRLKCARTIWVRGGQPSDKLNKKQKKWRVKERAGTCFLACLSASFCF